MPICEKPNLPYEYEKDAEEARMRLAKKRNKSTFGLQSQSVVAEVPECVENIIAQDSTKRMFSKWTTLKRVKDMYDEQVTKSRSDVFRAKILRHMKARIADMPPEQRKAWLTKLIRLAFLNKLVEIRDIKKMRNYLFLDKLEKSKGEDRNKLLEDLARLKSIYEFKELDDVQEVLELKKAKKDLKLKKAKELELKIRLKRLKKLEEIRQKEEKSMRNDRVEKLKEVISVRKNWQEEIINKIDDITKKLVEELVLIDDKRKWYDGILKDVEGEKRELIEEVDERKRREEMMETLKEEREIAAMKRDQKLKEIEAWRKERKMRLWKLDKVNKFQDFLENRYTLTEADENLKFKKIFNKLTASERKKIEVDPWDMKPKMGDRQRDMAWRKRLNSWIQSIVSSTRQKVVNKVRLKKYLEAMDSPQLDMLMSYSKRIESISNIMSVIRGRILRNTFPDKTKDFIAKEFNRIVNKTKTDMRDIDPLDKLLSVQITTKHHDLYLAVGDDFLTVVEQVVSPAEEPCQDKTDVLCLTANEREKMLEIIRKRQQSRKVVKETRLSEYESFQNRKALDDAWIKYMKKAYEETIRDLSSTCKRLDDDVVKIELQPDKAAQNTTSGTFEVAERDVVSQGAAVSVGLTEEQIQALVLGVGSSSKHGKKEKIKMDYGKAMDSRVDRLVKLAVDKDKEDPKSTKPYYARPRAQMKEILKKEKTIREHMVKDLPEEEEF